MFLDIGSGVGNIVAQVVLSIGVYKALGIELRSDIYHLGMDMMMKSAFTGRLVERAQFFCQDVSKLRISYTPPFADATIVYWNNVLFDPSVIEFVKNELCGMFMHKFLPETPRTVPRSLLCIVRIDKKVDVPCSWKAKLQRMFVYRAKDFE
ncbi:Hypothetical protein PHPALM_37503 [Phytophthora palmivora]|uniref:Histone-lysine N-methyltransferase, H3 lysine-79 specific n=1 Tax=Phytophthora palmivora TaxID=4796 RepID=A0A2P4WX87_9STRA|nr:Hypothetical protein PHPALM_37503 [Phytophthora palmivora]